MASIAFKLCVGRSMHEALEEAGKWCDRNSSFTNRVDSNWVPICNTALNEVEADSRYLHVVALVSSIGALCIGGWLLSTLTTASLLGVTLVLDAGKVIERMRVIHQGRDPTFMDRLEGAESLEQRVSMMLEQTLLLKRLPVHWVETTAKQLGFLYRT